MRIMAMKRAWQLRKEHGYTLATAMRLAWAELKGVKLYAMHLGHDRRKAISLYLDQMLENHLTGAHDLSKYQTLRNALRLPEDTADVVVMDGKSCGLCKYAIRQMAA